MSSEKKIILFITHILVFLVLISSHSHAEDLKRTVYKVSNISCGACVIKIDTRLRKSEGYIGLLVNIKEGLVVVEHDSALERREIIRAMTTIGYPTRALETAEVASLESVSSESPGWRSPSKGLIASIIRYFNQ